MQYRDLACRNNTRALSLFPFTQTHTHTHTYNTCLSIRVQICKRRFQFRGLECDYLCEGASPGDSDNIANQAHLNWQYTSFLLQLIIMKQMLIAQCNGCRIMKSLGVTVVHKLCYRYTVSCTTWQAVSREKKEIHFHYRASDWLFLLSCCYLCLEKVVYWHFWIYFSSLLRYLWTYTLKLHRVVLGRPFFPRDRLTCFFHAETNWINKLILKDSIISYCLTLFIFSRPCHISCFKQCSGDLIFLWEQLDYSVMEKNKYFWVCIISSLFSLKTT